MALNKNRKYNAKYKNELVLDVQFAKESIELVNKILEVCEEHKHNEFSVPVKVEMITDNHTFTVVHNLVTTNYPTKEFYLMASNNTLLSLVNSKNFKLDNTDSLFCEHQEDFSKLNQEFLDVFDS